MGRMTPTPVLDWRPNPDPRSSAFRFAALPGCGSLTARPSIQRRKAIFLDQGQEGACTGFGEEHVRALSPRPQITDNATAQRVYHEARRQDEWEGEAYEGSSVNGAMKASRLFGFISAWFWCYTTAELRHALSYHGAVEAGTLWWSGMWDVDEAGFVHPTGQVVGGHAYAISGYKTVNGRYAYRIDNSWGPDWGDHGGAWIWEEDIVVLLGNDGEFACPKKVA
jgi:hypothetical protein